MTTIVKAGSGRVWTIKFRAGPSHEPIYHQMGSVGTVSWGQGDVTKIEIPSELRYNEWEEIDSFQASPERATTTITVYQTMERSEILELVRLRCPFDIQIHKGVCDDPRDFDMGWEKIQVFEDARVTSYDANEQVAMQGDGQAAVMEDMPISARWIYDILRMTYREVAADEVGEEVVAVDVCDTPACGECDTPSDGCQRIFAICNSAGSSPGLLPQVVVTDDQFDVNAIIERWITTFDIGENATDGACVGTYLVVVSEDGEAAHYAPTADILDENETWTEVATGFVAGNGPLAMWNYSPLLTYIGGENGYVYLMKNPPDGVTVLDAGSVVTDNLNDIDGYDSENVGAVGDAGAFIYSTDGSNFSAGTAPAGPTDLYAIGYRTRKEIWVGGDDGNLYVTSNYGDDWTTKELPGAITQIDKIQWFSDTVGMVAGRITGPRGRVFRTINGGYSWYLCPENPALSVPTNDYINDIAFCEKDVNKAFLGGLADNGQDGILIKGSD